ncbi:hypothetical protein ['Paenibacillus yunnanensis' Narsing Rao et al. 2020]|uniref:hypothetical protein n=1 Tax=Paenibacillus tengchongensis TaxID=2608684 RepID=UPI001651CA41|nr:hypothetical protein [Paenibacillus tengchongensis]
MDKSKVITAYRRGFVTFRECVQILGIGEPELRSLLELAECKASDEARSARSGS